MLGTLRREHIPGVVAVGGEDTLGVAKKLFDRGMKVMHELHLVDPRLYGIAEVFFG